MNCPDCASELVETSTGYLCKGCGGTYEQLTLDLGQIADVKQKQQRGEAYGANHI